MVVQWQSRPLPLRGALATVIIMPLHSVPIKIARLISGHNSCNDRLIVNFCHKSVYIRTSMSKNHLNIILNLLSSFLCLRILARERELEECKRSLIEHTFLQPLNHSNFSREIPLWRWCSPGWTMDLRLLPVFRNSSWTGFIIIIIIYSFI